MGNQQIHYLKCWGEFFCELMNEERSFDYRVDDRGFSVGDCVVLEGYCPVEREYEGTAVRLVYRIAYILRNNKIGLPNGYCILEYEPWSGPLPVPVTKKKKRKGEAQKLRTKIE